MPRNSRGGGGFYRQEPSKSDRGQHPDLTPDGNVRPEAYMYADAAERDLNRKFREDQAFAGDLMDRITRYQSQLPEYVQHEVAGQTYGEGRGFAAGLTEYAREVERLKAEQDRFNHGAYATVVRDDQIEAMSLEEYDRHFDERGRPREGVVVEHGARSMKLNDGIDPWTAAELRNQR